MELSAREKRIIRQLNRPPHQFGFHMAASLVMLVAGTLSAIQAFHAHNQSDLWLGCLVATIGLFWAERLVTSRKHQRLIEKLIRVREGHE